MHNWLFYVKKHFFFISLPLRPLRPPMVYRPTVGDCCGGLPLEEDPFAIQTSCPLTTASFIWEFSASGFLQCIRDKGIAGKRGIVARFPGCTLKVLHTVSSTYPCQWGCKQWPSLIRGWNDVISEHSSDLRNITGQILGDFLWKCTYGIFYEHSAFCQCWRFFEGHTCFLWEIPFQSLHMVYLDSGYTDSSNSNLLFQRCLVFLSQMLHPHQHVLIVSLDCQ